MKIIKKEINTLNVNGDIISIKEEFLIKKLTKLSCRYEFRILKHSHGYYIERPYQDFQILSPSNGNEILFSILNIERFSFQKEVLGYNLEKEGGFPFCKTKEDTIKLMNSIILYNYGL